ncbi:hypothetical protein [Jeotgalibacillus haloalkalitolerans]|uniref:Phage protein n=1 Tax=Jeotgalibacillus haloalkalitolerans TaxID=3104292 RepID=A0ABU5KK82_9BACL|nr:hypothetical protein [Jeotgalibacillus sp. HH7-29]MDZ5711341.1 hypothetical protein [Jeotgalibacillus sp. HH7-29]
MQTFTIRNEKGEIFHDVIQPAVCFCKTTGTLFKIDELDICSDFARKTTIRYLAAAKHGIITDKEAEMMIGDMTIMDLPKDQFEIDKVYQIRGYVKSLYEKSRGIET